MTLLPPRLRPRDFTGYGRNPPYADWPGKARLAVMLVLNYEEGGERCLLNGDTESEAFLSDIVNAEPWPGQRHPNMESLYEYGARAGFWRLWRLFTRRGIPMTVNAVAEALAKSPEQVAAMKEANWEIASHGLRWLDYRDVPREEEQRHLEAAIRIHAQVTGERPLGWYLGRTSEQTLDLVIAEGGFVYSADSYADDLPYWVKLEGFAPHLIVPYTLDVNDMRCVQAHAFPSADEFFVYLRDAFDVLYAEGGETPKMMTVGLHARIIGRPARFAALARFLDHIESRGDVWLTRRIDLARHWHARHPWSEAGP